MNINNIDLSILNKTTYIFCQNAEEYVELMYAMYEEGARWKSGDSPLDPDISPNPPLYIVYCPYDKTIQYSIEKPDQSYGNVVICTVEDLCSDDDYDCGDISDLLVLLGINQ